MITLHHRAVRWLATLALSAGLAACAQFGSPGANFTAQDQAELVSLVQASAAAWNRGDLKGHVSIYDASVTVMTKSGPRPTIEAIEQSFGQAYFVNGKAKQQLSMDNITVRPLSASSALMTGKFVLSGGQEPTQSGWFTLVWLRTPKGWRAVHDHTS